MYTISRVAPKDYKSLYTYLYEIGSGASAKVYKFYDHSSKKIVAVKIIEDFKETTDNLRELSFLKSHSHHHIVKMHRAFLIDTTFHLVLEFCSLGNVGNYKSKMTEKILLCILRDVASALNYIHESNKIHFDIKPQNMLLTSLGEVKLADFGITRGDQSATIVSPGSKPGTPFYMAPEMLSGKPCTNKVDIYALGMTVFELATGAPLSLTSDKTITLWMNKNEHVFSSNKEKWSSFLERIVVSMLSPDPSDRPSAKTILEYPEIMCLPESWTLLYDCLAEKSDNIWR